MPEISTQGKFSKKDFLMMYDNVSMTVFEEWIEPVIPQVGWVKGKKQVFPPRVARIILEHLEQPISKKVLNV
ncbi:hypothetical protein [Spirosoma pomorum]